MLGQVFGVRQQAAAFKIRLKTYCSNPIVESAGKLARSKGFIIQFNFFEKLAMLLILQKSLTSAVRPTYSSICA
jgi:hypothetical protein